MQEIAERQHSNDLAALTGLISDRLSASMLDRIHDRIDTRRSPHISWKVAASVLLLFACGLGILLYSRLSAPCYTDGRKEKISTERGERKKIRLKDGTFVWLEPASTLKYPKEFNMHSRTVELTGEAFFEVAENEKIPFIVRAGSLETTVLGTSFNINAYNNRARATVTVVTGSVTVSCSNPDDPEADLKAELHINQKAVFDKIVQRLTKQEDPFAYRMFLRKEGKLIYEDTPLAVVIDDLSLRYDVKITLKGALGPCAYYGDFDLDNGLEEALQQICLTLNATLLKDAEDYIIEGKGC